MTLLHIAVCQFFDILSFIIDKEFRETLSIRAVIVWINQKSDFVQGREAGNQDSKTNPDISNS